MRIRTFAAIAAVLFILAGCAGGNVRYRETLETWIGQTGDDLILSWGIPSQTYTLSDGRKIIRYEERRKETIQGGTIYMPTTKTYSGYAGMQSYTVTSYETEKIKYPDTHLELECITEFVVSKEGIVVDWRFKGNDCR